MKKLFLVLALLCACVRVSATDVQIAASNIPNANFSNLGVNVTGNASATNGSTTVAFSSTLLPARYVGLGGYQISLAGTIYTVTSTESTSSLTLSTSYAGSTSASTAFILYPAVLLRVFSNQPFTPLGTSYVIQPGSPGQAGGWFKQIACTVRPISGIPTAILPEITLPATTDPAINLEKQTRLSAWFFRLDGSQLFVYGGFDSFRLPPTPSPTTWPTIRMYNTPNIPPPLDNATYSREQVNALIPSISGTPDYLLKSNAAGTGANSAAAYQSSGNIFITGATDLVGGIPSAAYSSLPTSSRGNGSIYWDSTNKQFRVYNSTSGLWVAVNGNVFNVQDFGAKPDALAKTSAGSISASSATLTCGTCTFTTADTGKVVYVAGAGASGAMLKTTGTYASATTLTLAAAASTTVAGATFYYGTDNTSSFQAALDAANTVGGGEVLIPPGTYIVDYVSVPKKTVFRGASRAATILWSARGSGGIVRSIWPSNASTSVDITIRDFTITALDTRSVQYGVHDNGGSHVAVENIAVTGAHYPVVFDQTEISRITGCNLVSYQPTYYGLMSGRLNPATNGSWTKTGAGTTGSDSGLWLINSSGLNTVNTYTKAIGSDAFVKGFLLLGSKGVSVAAAENAGFDDAKMYRVDNGTYRYDLQVTSTQIRLNGGTGRSFNATSNWRLEIAPGGATATLRVDNVEVDSNIAGLSSAGSAIVGFGDFTTTDDASVYYGPLTYVSAYRIPADIWLVNADAITPGNIGGYTNVIQIKNNHLNGNAVHVLDDGGTDHVIAENNINGGLWCITSSGTVNLTIQDNAFESSQWEAIYAHQWDSLSRSGGNPSGIKLIKNTINNTAITNLPPVRIVGADVVSLDTNVWTKNPSQGYLLEIDRSGVGRLEAPIESIPNGPDSIFDTTAITSLGANANDLAIGPFEIAYMTTDAARTVTGFSGGKDRRVVTIYNTGSFDLVLAHQSASSTAANRMISSTGLDLYVGPGQAARLTYDSASLRWRAMLLQ